VLRTVATQDIVAEEGLWRAATFLGVQAGGQVDVLLQGKLHEEKRLIAEWERRSEKRREKNWWISQDPNRSVEEKVGR